MSLFLTGSAGTGKSYFLQHYCEVTHKKFVKLAPTGLAALNIRGQTIHSFFRLPLAPLTDPNHTSAITRRYRKDKRELIRQLDLIIIDEISMVRCDLLDAMDRILRSVRHSKVPFGGVQLDVYKRQLQVADRDMYMRAVVSSQSVYTQQPVLVSLYLYSRYGNLAGVDRKPPEVTDFVTKEIPLQHTSLTTERVGGRLMYKALLWQLLAYPQRLSLIHI